MTESTSSPAEPSTECAALDRAKAPAVGPAAGAAVGPAAGAAAGDTGGPAADTAAGGTGGAAAGPAEGPAGDTGGAAAGPAGGRPASPLPDPARLPALYIGHGAPTLVDDAVWPAELAAWARDLPRPRAILIVSAHWESQPLTVGATTPVPLVYDFYGFPERYYRTRYDAPGAPDLALSVAKLVGDLEPVAQAPGRGLDHGAYVPLTVMYPEADVPVLQMSMPDLDPEHLFRIGQRLAPLRDEGVLVVGSGFLTHGLPYVREYMGGRPGAPGWSIEFDRWATEALARGDLDALFGFRDRAPGMPYAHPTVEHFAPLFVTLGAATVADETPDFRIDGYWMGLAKRSFAVR